MGKNFMTLDTETSYDYYQANGVKIKPIWDIAWVVTDNSGKVLKTESFLVREYIQIVPDKNISDHKAFPFFLSDIERIENFLTIWRKLLDDLQNFKISAIGAYNAAFDSQRIKEMLAYIHGSENWIDLPEFYDIWNLAVTTQALSVNYFQFCQLNGFITEKGNIQTSAEVMYRYLTKATDFVEKHLALDDSRIEAQIFHICKSSRKKAKSMEIEGAVWQKPQKEYRKWRDKEGL